jgi:hypothetical protein
MTYVTQSRIWRQTVDTMVLGTPCRLRIRSKYNFASVTVECFTFTGRKCANLVSRSIMTQIESNYLDVVGNPVIKSIPISSHFQDRIGNGCNIPADFRRTTFTLRQVSHLTTYLAILIFILVHQNLCFKS